VANQLYLIGLLDLNQKISDFQMFFAFSLEIQGRGKKILLCPLESKEIPLPNLGDIPIFGENSYKPRILKAHLWKQGDGKNQFVSKQETVTAAGQELP